MTRFRRNHGGRVKLPPFERVELAFDRAHVQALDALAQRASCGRRRFLWEMLLNTIEREFQQTFGKPIAELVSEQRTNQ